MQHFSLSIIFVFCVGLLFVVQKIIFRLTDYFYRYNTVTTLRPAADLRLTVLSCEGLSS